MDLSALNNGQKDVVTSRKATCVEAGAGTGKTFTLSHKAAAHMEDGLEPEKLTAITFTENAAAQLMAKVSASVKATGIENAAYIEAADISTIHAKCKKMLTENALDAPELGLDPGMMIIADDEDEEVFDAAVEKAFKSGWNGAAAEKAGGLSALRNLSVFIARKSLSIPDGIGSIYMGTASSSSIDKAVLQSLEASLVTLIADSNATGKPTDASNAEIALQAQQGLVAAKNDEERVEALLGLDSMKATTSLKTQVKPIKENAIKLAYSASAASISSLILPEATRLANEIVNNYDSELKRMKMVSLDSLLRKTALLLSNDDTAEHYSESVGLLMVDEFQDTDPIQANIVRRLCTDETGLDKLVVVGDRQQSIYSFRDADPEVSEEIKSIMQDDNPDALVKLNENYRSNEEILDFTCFFANPDFFGKNFLRLVAGGDNKDAKIDADPAVELRRFVSPKKPKTLSSNLIKASAADIAANMRKLHDSGSARWGQMALLLRSYTNVNVFRAALTAAGIPNAITGGQRFYSFTEVSAAIDLVNVICGEADDLTLFQLLEGEVFQIPDAELISLKIAWRERKNTLEGEEEMPSLWEVLNSVDLDQNSFLFKARKTLNDTIALIGKQPLSSCYLHAVEQSGWQATVWADELGGAARYGNIIKVADIIEETSNEKGERPHEIAEALTTLRDLADDKISGSDKTEKPGRIMGDSGDGYVSIMTIHSSKGLEADIVFVGQGETSGKPTSLFTNSLDINGTRTSCLAWKPSGLKVPEYTGEDPEADAANATTYADYLLAMSAYHMQLDRDESDRLLYVALTRAKKKLYWYDTSSNADSRMARAWRALGLGELETAQSGDYGILNGHSIRYFVTEVPQRETETEPTTKIFRCDGNEAEVELAQHSNIEVHRATRTFSYSLAPFTTTELIGHPLDGNNAIVTFDEKDMDFISNYEDYDYETTLTSSGSSNPRSFGSAFHALVQKHILLGEIDEHDIEREITRYSLNDYDATKLRKTIGKWFVSVEWATVENAERLFTEVPVALTIDDKAVRGTIDLAAISGNKAIVYDYKTGMWHKTPHDISEKYGLQALLYSYALLLSDTIDEVAFNFVLVEKDTNRTVAMPVWRKENLSQMETELTKALRYAESHGR